MVIGSRVVCLVVRNDKIVRANSLVEVLAFDRWEFGYFLSIPCCCFFFSFLIYISQAPFYVFVLCFFRLIHNTKQDSGPFRSLTKTHVPYV